MSSSTDFMSSSTDFMSSSTDFMSFYIPYVPKNWDEESIRGLFADLQIGLVDRVDFFDNGNWAWALSAFVHLKCWAYSDYADLVYDQIQTVGQWHLRIPNQPGSRYFVLKKMTCEKIQETHLNVHQLAAKMADMEFEIHELRTALISTRVAEEVLRDDHMMETENIDFYTKYNASVPLSLVELADQTQDFRAKRDWVDWRMDVESDEGSANSAESATKRIRTSAELCGNN